MKKGKIFILVWGLGYSGCNKEAKTEYHSGTSAIFTFKAGFEDDDIKKIDELEIGRSAEFLDSGNLSIVRIK